LLFYLFFGRLHKIAPAYKDAEDQYQSDNCIPVHLIFFMNELANILQIYAPEIVFL
jgi:hypothetical protein